MYYPKYTLLYHCEDAIYIFTQENYRRMLAEALLKDYDGSVNDLCETPLATFVNEVLIYW